LTAALAQLHPRLRNAPEGIPFVMDERTLAQGMNFTLQTDLGEIDLLASYRVLDNSHRSFQMPSW
jgi:hypothetical protein